MIENLKELLRSEDQDRVKQGIELILNLGMEEELYLEFKDLLDDSSLSTVEPGPDFLGLFQEGHNQSLPQACLLALIKALNESQQLTDHLILNVNPYFEEFDLLDGCFDDVEDLELNGFKWEQIKQILESNPQVKALKLSGRSMINWSESTEIFSKQLDQLSLSWMEINSFFHEDQYDTLLPLLEKGMAGSKIHKVDTIESMLKECDIDLGEEKGDRYVSETDSR